MHERSCLSRVAAGVWFLLIGVSVLVSMLPTQLKPQAVTLLSLLPEVAWAFPVLVVAEQSPLWTAM